jgi:hypothetical protein
MLRPAALQARHNGSRWSCCRRIECQIAIEYQVRQWRRCGSARGRGMVNDTCFGAYPAPTATAVANDGPTAAVLLALDQQQTQRPHELVLVSGFTSRRRLHPIPLRSPPAADPADQTSSSSTRYHTCGRIRPATTAVVSTGTDRARHWWHWFSIASLFPLRPRAHLAENFRSCCRT